MHEETREFLYDPSEFQALAFTVKKLGNDEVSIEDYRINVLSKWARLAVQIEEPYFEDDSKGKLHMHGVVVTRKNYYRRKLSVPGYYVYVTDCWNIERWLEYCSKVNKSIKVDNTLYLFGA